MYYPEILSIRKEAALEPYADISDPRILQLLAHPLRVRIMGVLDRRVASPSELAELLEAPLGTVSYHVRKLHRLGLIELVRETRSRGAVGHHYAAHRRGPLSDEAWRLVELDRQGWSQVGAVLRTVQRQIDEIERQCAQRTAGGDLSEIQSANMVMMLFGAEDGGSATAA